MMARKKTVSSAAFGKRLRKELGSVAGTVQEQMADLEESKKRLGSSLNKLVRRSVSGRRLAQELRKREAHYRAALKKLSLEKKLIAREKNELKELAAEIRARVEKLHAQVSIAHKKLVLKKTPKKPMRA